MGGGIVQAAAQGVSDWRGGGTARSARWLLPKRAQGILFRTSNAPPRPPCERRLMFSTSPWL